MLDYEWGNPSSIMLTGDEPTHPQHSDNQTRHVFDPYATQTFNDSPFFNPNGFNTPQHFHQAPTQPHTHFQSQYDPRPYGGSYAYPPHPHPAMLSLEPVGGTASGSASFMAVPKSEPVGVDFTSSRIGLNLGGRTYFSSSEDDFVNRLYRRSSPLEPGSVNTPRCQAEGCNADLTHAKHYHRRHKVCEFHSKAATVVAAGLTQRFCQQCSRFHLLSEFDNGKRSCRKRLADHNRRRRKSQQQQPQPPNQESSKSQLEQARNSSSESLARSPADSGAHASSSVTVAISPPRISLSYQAATTSSLTFRQWGN
ncbi:hypothetical protein RJ639_042222 [Escallonia herrerae]|uniref:SBP-type domain-containing protein n=1 Tax=Escallonia herrerae TaxID=1293975 RepID=A0AA88WLF3_9ASTE|nr:hypothetical protein RJ639_042222 [Escallonia herrerae]